VNQLAPAVTALRLSLHVLAATIWVGGQLTIAGLVPDLRALGGDATVRVARAFARISWPAFLVLLLTGIWNVAAAHGSTSTTAWQAVLGVKVFVAVHQRARSRAGLAAWGAVAGVASVTAVVLGVLLAG